MKWGKRGGGNPGELHIGVLDGIRALAVLVVAWFHFWQQSWVMPIGYGVNLDWIPRTGYVMVDLLLLLSGLCLFLPHARGMVAQSPGISSPRVESVPVFYFRRLIRIFPSYLFNILVVLFCFNLPLGVYGSLNQLLFDLFTHLTFTHTFFPETYLFTQLNGALWTLATEMQFYLLFPLLAWAFRKRPLLTYAGMTGISLAWNFYFAAQGPSMALRMGMIQLPSFLGVYANGMLAAWIIVAMKNSNVLRKKRGAVCTALALSSLVGYWLSMGALCKSENQQVWQVAFRYPLSLLFGLFVVSLVFAASWFRWLLDNRFCRFLAGISFNFYIWHQFLAVQLKALHIPPWTGEKPPNEMGDEAWKIQYFLLTWAVSLAAAILTTYCIERPAAAFLQKHRQALLRPFERRLKEE